MSAKLTKVTSDISSKTDQESGESINSYVASLCNLAKTCTYGSLLDSLICDRILVGIRDNAHVSDNYRRH